MRSKKVLANKCKNNSYGALIGANMYAGGTQLVMEIKTNNRVVRRLLGERKGKK